MSERGKGKMEEEVKKIDSLWYVYYGVSFVLGAPVFLGWAIFVLIASVMCSDVGLMVAMYGSVLILALGTFGTVGIVKRWKLLRDVEYELLRDCVIAGFLGVACTFIVVLLLSISNIVRV